MSARLKVDEVAEMWQCDRRIVLAAIADKESPLPAVKIAGRWLIEPDDVEAYEDARRNVPRPKIRERRPPRKRGKKAA